MGYQVPSYGAYQPSRQVPGISTQPIFTPGDQPAPPNYQSLTPSAQPHPGQRQGQPSYQAGNQYEAPNAQFQNLSLQNVSPVPNQAQPTGGQPQLNQAYQPVANPPQTQSIVSQGQTTHYLQGSQPNQYRVVNEKPREGQTYATGPDYPSSGPMSYQNQLQKNMYTHTPPSSGPPSMESYSSGPNSLQENMTGGVTHHQGQPQSFTGTPPTQTQPPQPFPPGQSATPPQQFPPLHQSQTQFQLQQHPYPQHAAQSQGPPPQPNILSQGVPTQNSQVPQYQGGQPSQSHPQGSGTSSLQYQNQPVDPTYQHNAEQQPWGQAPNGNYQQPPPSYGGYEPVQQPYNQQQSYGQQQFYEQNVAEAQLISFD